MLPSQPFRRLRVCLWLTPLVVWAAPRQELRAALQQAVERSMAGKPGAVVVAEVSTGRLLAQHRLELAATRLAAPGSAVKPFTLLALLESGNAGRLVCERQLRLGARRLDCTHPQMTLPLEPASALAYSCNSYFARSALRLQPPELARAFERAGLASLTGWAAREAAGSIRTARSAEELQLQALGEDGIQVTPLGLLAAYRRLALLRASSNPTLAPLFEGLEGAVAYGTAQLAQTAGLAVAGKTGTTAAPSRAWTHAWFAGYAPAAAPEIVLVVFLEQGAGGPGAAPVAGAIFEAYRRVRSAPREVAVRLYWLHPPAEMPPLDWKGPLEVKRQGGRLLLTVRMPLEEYVAGVLAGESSVFTSQEALKAMAVAARTYALGHLGRHRSEGFDFCDTTHCQDLRLAALNDRFRAIAEATEGELLWYQGSPAATYYHRHCGGTTEAARNLWPEIRAPYLRQQTDTFCIATGRGDWHSQVLKEDLLRALGTSSLEVLRRTPSGRVAELRAGGKPISAPAFEQALGRALGFELVRSSRFEIIDRGDRLVFQGYGFGHGVGLCQTGAQQRGAQGHSYRQILEFYYPGTVLGVSAQGFTWAQVAGERVELASTRAREDQSLVALADRLLKEAETRAGFPLTFRPRLKVYPSVAAFRDSTGEPGWVAASTLGRTIRLQPLPLLRSTGTLESTLLHEMLHLLIESRAHPSLPAWFREGLALYLTNAQGPKRPDEARVRALLDRHGRRAVMDWLLRGLPPGVG